MPEMLPQPAHALLLSLMIGCGGTTPEDTATLPPADTAPDDTGDAPSAFTGELRVDLQPGEWPNEIALGEDIVVAVLARNGFEPADITDAEVRLWNAEETIELAPTGSAGLQDVDGDGLDDHLFQFSYDAAMFSGSGPIRVKVGEYTAEDHFVDDTRLAFVYPELLGPYAVGTTSFDWEDTSRPDTRTAALEYRRLPIQIWYPADLPADAQPSAHYLRRDESILIANYLGIYTTYFDYLFSHAHLNAPVSTAQDKWPVLVFSHGYGVQLPNQTAFVQNAASHGFIVVGLQHTYSTAYTMFQDGTLATTYINPASDTAGTQDMWTADLRFVLDQIEVLDTDDARFAGRLDLDRMGAFGYSFGGSTTSELCRTDDRILAGLNVDGTFYGDDTPGFEQAFMLINAANNFEDDNRAPVLNAMNGTTYNLSIPDARHQNFNDYALQDEYISALTGGGHGLSIGTIDSRLAYEIVHTYIAAFFGQHVTGESAALLGEDSPWPEAEFEVWNP